MADKGYDPGWNDPPKLSYNPESSIAKPKNLLNKRVPFSMNGPNANKNTDIGQYTQPPINLPPPLETLPPVNLPPICKKPLDNSSISNEIDIEKLTETIRILNQILDNNSELSAKSDSIKKRIVVMESMWKEGKLCSDVQLRTFQLAQALESSNSQRADELHKSLMVDYSSSVSMWMVGIKQLIMHCTIVNELLEIDKE